MTRYLFLALACLLSAVSCAATPSQEKQFVDAYRKALETKDEKALAGFLYTKGADPLAVEVYQMMMKSGMSKTISSIELQPLDAEDVKKTQEMTDPNGKPIKLNLTPVRKLVIKSGSGSSTGTDRVFVAEDHGKLVIPVPGYGS